MWILTPQKVGFVREDASDTSFNARSAFESAHSAFAASNDFLIIARLLDIKLKFCRRRSFPIISLREVDRPS